MNLATSFSQAITNAFRFPPKNDGDPNGWYAHRYLGRHARFTGRTYKRGKTRCAYCGARLDCLDGPVDPDRFMNPMQRMKRNIEGHNRLIQYLRTSP